MDESTALTRARVHVPGSSGLVTYLPTYERLKAFHSRLYFRPVNRVPLPLSYETAAAAACGAKRRALSLFSSLLSLFASLSPFLPPSFSSSLTLPLSLLFPHSRGLRTDLSEYAARTCASTLGIATYILASSRRTAASSGSGKLKRLRERFLRHRLARG